MTCTNCNDEASFRNSSVFRDIAIFVVSFDSLTLGDTGNCRHTILFIDRYVSFSKSSRNVPGMQPAYSLLSGSAKSLE